MHPCWIKLLCVVHIHITHTEIFIMSKYFVCQESYSFEVILPITLQIFNPTFSVCTLFKRHEMIYMKLNAEKWTST